MKYIKTYESNDTSYLKNYKKYILIVKKSNGHFFIFHNMGNQLKKLYSNEYGEFKQYDKPFYFGPHFNRFKEMFKYDSDNLDDILKNVDLILTANKYNL